MIDMKKIEQELEESRERYRSLVENSGAGITTVDTKGSFTFY